MSGSNCWTPKDGRHRQEFYSLLLFYSTPSICSEGACTLRGSVNFDIIPVANGVRVDAAFRVGYQLPILLKSVLTASREKTHNNKFLLFSNNDVPRIVFALAKTKFA